MGRFMGGVWGWGWGGGARPAPQGWVSATRRVWGRRGSCFGLAVPTVRSGSRPPPSFRLTKNSGGFKKKSLVTRGLPPCRVGAGGVLWACPNPKKGLRARAGTPKPRCCRRRLGRGRRASPPLLPQKGSDVLLPGAVGAFWSQSRDLGHPRAFGGPGLRAGCPRAQLGVCEVPVWHRWGILGVRLWSSADTTRPRCWGVPPSRSPSCSAPPRNP